MSLIRALIQELGPSAPSRWLAFCMEAMQHGALTGAADDDDVEPGGEEEGQDKKKVRKKR